MFWRSFNLTFKANLFDGILMQPQKKLFFGFSELSLENLVSPFQFFRGSQRQQFIFSTRILLPTPKISLFGTFSRLPQAAKVVLASVKGQKWFFNEQKSFFSNDNRIDNPYSYSPVCTTS